MAQSQPLAHTLPPDAQDLQQPPPLHLMMPPPLVKSSSRPHLAPVLEALERAQSSTSTTSSGPAESQPLEGRLSRGSLLVPMDAAAPGGGAQQTIAQAAAALALRSASM